MKYTIDMTCEYSFEIDTDNPVFTELKGDKILSYMQYGDIIDTTCGLTYDLLQKAIPSIEVYEMTLNTVIDNEGHTVFNNWG